MPISSALAAIFLSALISFLRVEADLERSGYFFKKLFTACSLNFCRSTFRFVETVPVPGFLNPISPDPLVDLAEMPKNPFPGPSANRTRISVGFFL